MSSKKWRLKILRRRRKDGNVFYIFDCVLESYETQAQMKHGHRIIATEIPWVSFSFAFREVFYMKRTPLMLSIAVAIGVSVVDFILFFVFGNLQLLSFRLEWPE